MKQISTLLNVFIYVCGSYWERRTERGEYKRIRVYVEYTARRILRIPRRVVTLDCTGVSVRAYRNVEVGEEYFITMQQIMLNLPHSARVRGGYYANIHRMSTARPTPIRRSIWNHGEMHLYINIPKSSYSSLTDIINL